MKQWQGMVAVLGVALTAFVMILVGILGAAIAAILIVMTVILVNQATKVKPVF